jgi:hypothetical protein
MSLVRHMFINYSSQIITVSVTTYENVGVFEMQTSGAVETQVDTQYLGGGSSSTWDLRVPAGGIRGFGVTNGASYSNPNSDLLTILTAAGKNPWPTPPPPPGLFESVTDFEDRYEDFLTALSGERAPRRDRAPAPAPARTPRDT